MNSKKFEIKNLIGNNLSLTVPQFNQLPYLTILQVNTQFPSSFKYSNKKKYIKFNGCAFELIINGNVETLSNESIHSNPCSCENWKSEAN
jgi:hypothetical protein